MTNKDIFTQGEQYIMNNSRLEIVPKEGKGCHLTDWDGREYLDLTSGIGVNALGYCDPEWAEAIYAQAKTMSHCSNYYYTKPNVDLADKLLKITGMSKIFFGNSGAEANEGAIKLARKYSFDKYGKGRGTILTLKNSFHGRTITTLEATGQDVFHNYFFPFTEGFIYVDANDMSSVKAADNGQICAIMMEAVQGEGGVLPLDESFVKEVAAYAKEKDWLIIFDEVQTGIGRTGKPFGYMHYDIAPDILSCAKGIAGGLPMGAILCASSCKDVLSSATHASTFGGNPIVSAGALVVLDRVMNPAFLEEVTQKGEYIKGKVAKAALPCVKDIRGRGLMIGIELSGVSNKDVLHDLLDLGVMTITAGNNVLRLLPPLVIDYNDIDRGIDLIIQVLKKNS
jgi:acetylornithine/N-succinyldiaminopimelate aminotransferase